MKFSITTLDPDDDTVILTGVYESEDLRLAFGMHIFALVKKLALTAEPASNIEFQSYELYHGIMSERDMMIEIFKRSMPDGGVNIGQVMVFSPNNDDYAKHVTIRIN